MSSLFDHLSMAWNPIGQVRRRREAGKLRLWRVALPFAGVVTGCRMVVVGYETWVLRSGWLPPGVDVPELAQAGHIQWLAISLGLIVGSLLVRLLPARWVAPATPSEVAAAVLVVDAAWAFYDAVLSTGIYSIAALVGMLFPDAGRPVFVAGSVLGALVLLPLLLFFVVRTFRGVLQLSWGSLALLSGVLVVAVAVHWILTIPLDLLLLLLWA